ncbi:metallopeptidase family protein [Anaerolineae bacterium CFX7]|nr:metallopeptidase family protein [Anaerolineae bacterium CFX7]
MTNELSVQEFYDVIDETMERLPQEFQAFLSDEANFAIEVEEYPDWQTMQLAGVTHPNQLLGFYHGIPRTERTSGYNMVLPDKISLYRQPLMRHYRTRASLTEGIRHTLLHEIAHHFGISDERLRELGAY